MRKVVVFLLLISFLSGGEKMKVIKLPQPQFKGKMSVEEALKNRRSIRRYKKFPLTLKELAQILWACDGKTSDWGGRTAPSAGATYPLEIYVVVGDVEGLKPGIYHYNVSEHSLELISEGDVRRKLAEDAWGQSMILEAPVTVVISGIFERTTTRYGERGKRYVFMEVGHCGQNIHLQAESLGLGTVMVGAFQDAKVKRTLGIKEDVFYLCPVGKK